MPRKAKPKPPVPPRIKRPTNSDAMNRKGYKPQGKVQSQVKPTRQVTKRKPRQK